MEQIQWPSGITRKETLGAMLKAASDSAWPVPDEEDAAMFAFATIHSVKGREFPAVGAALPKKLREDAASPGPAARGPVRGSAYGGQALSVLATSRP